METYKTKLRMKREEYNMFREGWVLEVLHDDFFIDEATVSLLHSIKGEKRKYLL